jgi:hypothetical protein
MPSSYRINDALKEVIASVRGGSADAVSCPSSAMRFTRAISVRKSATRRQATEAIYLGALWGADGKVKQLDRRYPQLAVAYTKRRSCRARG